MIDENDLRRVVRSRANAERYEAQAAALTAAGDAGAAEVYRRWAGLARAEAERLEAVGQPPLVVEIPAAVTIEAAAQVQPASVVQLDLFGEVVLSGEGRRHRTGKVKPSLTRAPESRDMDLSPRLSGRVAELQEKIAPTVT